MNIITWNSSQILWHVPMIDCKLEDQPHHHLQPQA